jgi:hypothetical protein
LPAELSDAQVKLHDEMTLRDTSRQAQHEAEAEFARGRERVRVA